MEEWLINCLHLEVFVISKRGHLFVLYGYQFCLSLWFWKWSNCMVFFASQLCSVAHAPIEYGGSWVRCPKLYILFDNGIFFAFHLFNFHSDDNALFVLDKHTFSDFYSASSLKQLSNGILQIPKHFVEVLGTYLQNKNHFSGSPSLECQHT
jgi:hypothetical protein